MTTIETKEPRPGVRQTPANTASPAAGIPRGKPHAYPPGMFEDDPPAPGMTDDVKASIDALTESDQRRAAEIQELRTQLISRTVDHTDDMAQLKAADQQIAESVGELRVAFQAHVDAERALPVGVLQPWLAALMRGLLVAIVAGGTAAVTAASAMDASGRGVLIAFLAAALPAFAVRAGLEGQIDQKAKDAASAAPRI